MKECCRSYMEAEFGGDQDVIAEIYAEYAKSVKEKAAEAAGALAAAQWDALDKVAHTVKGNALAAGDGETAEAAIALRNAAKLQDAALAGGCLAKLGELAAGL